MANPIGYCTETVNFFTGCNGPHGERCTFCYAARMAHRLAGNPTTVYHRVRAVTGDEFAPAFHADVYRRAVERFQRGQRPRRIFVGSMADLCFVGKATLLSAGAPVSTAGSKEVQQWTAAFADAVPQHTVLVLTKRPDLLDSRVRWPANAHLGVSLAGNDDADRVAQLHDWWARQATRHGNRADGLPRGPGVLWASVEPLQDPGFDPACLKGLDWVVVGVETGPGRRWNIADAKGRMRAVERVVAWGRRNGVPIWVKDNARELWTPTTRTALPQELPR